MGINTIRHQLSFIANMNHQWPTTIHHHTIHSLQCLSSINPPSTSVNKKITIKTSNSPSFHHDFTIKTSISPAFHHPYGAMASTMSHPHGPPTAATASRLHGRRYGGCRPGGFLKPGDHFRHGVGLQRRLRYRRAGSWLVKLRVDRVFVKVFIRFLIRFYMFSLRIL